MTLYNGFHEDSVRTITRAIEFTMGQIDKEFERRKALIDEVHHETLDKEKTVVKSHLEFARKFINENNDKFYEASDQFHSELLDTIRSALELYVLSLQSALGVAESPALERDLLEAHRVISLENVKKAKSELYRQYSQLEPLTESTQIMVFVCYKESPDKELAGKIRKLFENKGVNAFVAHDDIRLGKAWMDELRKNIGKAQAMVPVVTDDFGESDWTNQEVGFAEGKGKTIIPIWITEKMPGFLAEKQGVKAELENLEEAVNKVIAQMKESKHK